MKVITFSQVFPGYHSRKGEQTGFVHKILLGQKVHTIRAGNRWKAGDIFSARIWTGKPYKSKQEEIAQLEVKSCQTITHELDEDYHCILIDGKPFHEWNSRSYTNIGGFETLAKNDGLSVIDLMNWFPKPFAGQIICWKENIKY